VGQWTVEPSTNEKERASERQLVRNLRRKRTQQKKSISYKTYSVRKRFIWKN